MSLLCKKRTFFLVITSLILFIGVLSVETSAQSFTGKGCQNNQLCDTTTTCDTTTNKCTTTYTNCMSCGTTTISCPLGTTTAQKTCTKTTTGATCSEGQPVCPELTFTEPTALASFTVFVSKDLDIAVNPQSLHAVPGQAASYQLTLMNKNPKDLYIRVGVQVPTGWTVDAPADITLAPTGTQNMAVTVTSPTTASQGEYTVTISFLNEELQLFAAVKLKYIVTLQGPPGLTITPKEQKGPPGSTRIYTINVTNTDPADFDASTIALDVQAPDGWTAELAQSSLNLEPKTSGTTTLAVTAATDVQEAMTFSIPVNASANGQSSIAFAQFAASLCGNGICELNEVCSEDCPTETSIFCNGRCEREIDDGVRYRAVVNNVFDRFIVCDHSSTTDACTAAFQQNQTCGAGSPCLCSGEKADCNQACVDTTGAYYMLASIPQDVARSNANYSYACPFVNLAELTETRTTFADAMTSYEQSKSAYDEQLQTANSTEEKAKIRPCDDALDMVLKEGKKHLAAFDEVLSHPSKSGAARIRTENSAVKATIGSTIAEHCQGARGLLHFTTVEAPTSAIKGDTAHARVSVKNVGTILYYGYASCDFIAPNNDVITVKTACTQFPAQATKTFKPETKMTTDGTWKFQCQMIGSLESDCSSTVHDQTDVIEFGAGTNEVFVSDVAGTCDFTGMTCDVTTNLPKSCVTCSIGSIPCTLYDHNDTHTTFTCPRQADFVVNVTAAVFPTSACIPVDPTQKLAEVRCPSCGDGIVQEQNNEQCELPNIDNNTQCAQEKFICDGKRQGVRDEAGFCTPSCGCSPDPYMYSCVAGACSAQCSDGDVKEEVVHGVTYERQCLSSCEWSDINVEAPPADQGQAGNISITSDPTGADLRFDNAAQGTTPVLLHDIAAGYHNVRVSKSGYYNFENYTFVAAGAVTTVHIDLQSTTSANPPATPDLCKIKISTASCNFNKDSNRYDVSFAVNWTGGDHAHASVDLEGAKQPYRDKNFVYSGQQGVPGFKTLNANVHDATDHVICSDQSQIYCGPGNATGSVVDVIRSMPEIVSFGNVTITLQIIPYQDIATFELDEYVEPTFLPRNIIINGNTSSVQQANPYNAIDGKNYNVYAFTTPLTKSKTINISYTISAQKAGTFTFIALAKYNGEQKKKSVDLDVTSCMETHPVYAVNDAGECQQFKTSCDVDTLQGWSIVTECPTTEQQPAIKTQDTTWMIIFIIVLVVIVGVAYYKREAIQEKIEEWQEQRAE
ncbi:MAG: PEGA domain-containing protein [Candidatus Aenigmarchaeota archaeon]|nr:PEGA domain-containing protein [Candidatus Aenigmarchaeota archaeon]